jgi:hypothetical protein
MATNCTICLDPISRFSSQTFTLSCQHKLHPGCVVNLTDSIRREKPAEGTLDCPECRKPSPLPYRYSADRILDWAAVVNKAATVFSGMLAGLSAALALIKIVSWRKSLTVLPYSLLLISIPHSILIKMVTVIYNRVYGVNIKSHFVDQYASLRGRPDKEIAREVIASFLEKKIKHCQDTLALPCLSDQKALLQPFVTTIHEIDTKIILGRMMNTLKDKPDLKAAIYQRGIYLGDEGNENLKSALSTFVEDCLLAHLEYESTSTVWSSSLEEVIQISLLCALQLATTFKPKMPSKQKDLINFLKEWQSDPKALVERLMSPDLECRDGLSDLTDGNLTKLVFSNDLHVRILKALKEDFEKAGLGLQEVHNDEEEKLRRTIISELQRQGTSNVDFTALLSANYTQLQLLAYQWGLNINGNDAENESNSDGLFPPEFLAELEELNNSDPNARSAPLDGEE